MGRWCVIFIAQWSMTLCAMTEKNYFEELSTSFYEQCADAKQEKTPDTSPSIYLPLEAYEYFMPEQQQKVTNKQLNSLDAAHRWHNFTMYTLAKMGGGLLLVLGAVATYYLAY